MKAFILYAFIAFGAMWFLSVLLAIYFYFKGYIKLADRFFRIFMVSGALQVIALFCAIGLSVLNYIVD
ncbi:hypothetical protein [Gallibacterium anatis]|uniref:hypothetical protein n=1 Tax=Gallibacterium anatis TaxID=750 RepID=UPI0005315AC7|nr:hypothetical protein [Gallibacterium anatis]KGQ44485.1 hypothetical protein JP29_09055 [Gallibacterium anatis]